MNSNPLGLLSMEEKFMKRKILFYSLGLAVVSMLTGCNDDNRNPNNRDNSNTEMNRQDRTDNNQRMYGKEEQSATTDPYYYQNPMYSNDGTDGSYRGSSAAEQAYAQDWFFDNNSGYRCDDNGYCMYGDEHGAAYPRNDSGRMNAQATYRPMDGRGNYANRPIDGRGNYTNAEEPGYAPYYNPNQAYGQTSFEQQNPYYGYADDSGSNWSKNPNATRYNDYSARQNQMRADDNSNIWRNDTRSNQYPASDNSRSSNTWNTDRRDNLGNPRNDNSNFNWWGSDNKSTTSSSWNTDRRDNQTTRDDNSSNFWGTDNNPNKSNDSVWGAGKSSKSDWTTSKRNY